jgi:dolichol-phosphate mannosyltransferase
MTNPSPVLSIVIPVFNEEAGLPALLQRLQQLLPALDQARPEIIFVDDHSADNSPALLKAACHQNPALRYFRLSRNRGSHVAILAGLEQARGECAVFLASDLQDPPELITKMLEQWRAGRHVVWAVRESREGISWFDQFCAKTFYALLNRFGQVQLPPQGSDFALLDRKVIDALLQSTGANPSLSGEIARLGFSQGQIPYTKEARQHGHSKWSFERRLRAVVDAFVLFSYKPLRVMSHFGMVCSTLGFLYALFVIALRLFGGRRIEGWASLMVVVLVLGGIQMVMLGVLGEYLWRTLEEARRAPRYFFEVTEKDSPATDIGCDDARASRRQ